MTEAGKIAIYLPSLGGGGAERSMVTLANGFAARGYKVDLVLAQAKGPYISEVLGNVNIIDLSSSGVLASLPGLVRYLTTSRPKVLLSAMGHANVIALLANCISGKQCNTIISERMNFRAFQSHYKSLKDYVVRVMMRLTYGWAQAVVIVANDMKKELVEYCQLDPGRIHTIYNPVVGPKLADLAAEQPNHSWLSPASSIPVILAAGRLSKEKDFMTLLSAFSILRQRSDAKLIILGEGPERAALQHEISRLELQEAVDLPGFVSNPFCFMSRASLFVLSSQWEGLPGVLIQAMACGAPVVSTNCPTGPSEILEQGKWGRLVPVGDPEAMALAMQEALNEKERPDIKLRAAEFSEDNAVKRYLALMMRHIGT